MSHSPRLLINLLSNMRNMRSSQRCSRFGLCAQAEAATLKHFSTYKGAPMQLDFCHHFQQNGELQDRVALKKDADTQLHHQNAFLHSQLLRSEDIVSAALPVYRRHQRSPITTKQATGFHKNTRHSCIILLVDSTILFNLTQLAINSDDDRDKTLLSVSLMLTVCQMCIWAWCTVRWCTARSACCGAYTQMCVSSAVHVLRRD